MQIFYYITSILEYITFYDEYTRHKHRKEDFSLDLIEFVLMQIFLYKSNSIKSRRKSS